MSSPMDKPLTAPVRYLAGDVKGSPGEGIPGSKKLEGDIRKYKLRKKLEREGKWPPKKKRWRSDDPRNDPPGDDEWGGGDPYPS